MTISSRTPEGLPHRCPICGKLAALEPSYPDGDSICPACGHLLWWFRDRYGGTVQLDTSFGDVMDSLDLLEVVMELEEEFHITIPDEEVEQIKTVEEAIRLIERHRSG
jgi:acyl carrier protein